MSPARPFPSRRSFLRAGALTLGAGAVASGPLALAGCTSSPDSTTVGAVSADAFGGTGASLVEPPTIQSAGQVLEVELVAEAGATVGGQATRLSGYNGMSPGPTLRACPGDTLKIRLTNRLDEPTSIHTHGLHVSPEGNADNPFLTVEPGQSHDYEIPIPADHPAGTYWYHPHPHGRVAQQVFDGLFGALIIDGDDEPTVDRERVLIISDVSLDADGTPVTASSDDVMWGRLGNTVLINGQSQPLISLAPGGIERWRIVNACASRHVRLANREQRLIAIGFDGHPVAALAREEFDLASGNRLDVLVAGGGKAASLVSPDVPRGGTAALTGNEPQLLLASIEGLDGRNGSAQDSSAQADGAAWVPARAEESLAEVTVDRTRVLAFTMSMPGAEQGAAASTDAESAAAHNGDEGHDGHSEHGGSDGGGAMAEMVMGFNDEPFQMDTVNITVEPDAVEQWVIQNPTGMDHPFHLHVWPMQVMSDSWGESEALSAAYAAQDPEVGAAHAEAPVLRDVINVPAGEQVVVRIRFSGITGRTVYHCHVLDHEDAGMMGIIETA
ncbi:MAG: multicopper oxidase family protein [Dermabacter sp.]|nr:multicopper oxidase family protein [Dermabacter sp.]